MHGTSFACNGCGDCCRGREDIVLSGFDLWRITPARLRLPPQIVARGYCRASIGTVSHLRCCVWPGEGEPEQLSLPYGDHCAIHDAEPLVCALYPLAQEISRKDR